MLLPIGFRECMAISKYKKTLTPYTNIPIADYGAMEIAADKNKTMKFANKIGVLTPSTIYPDSIDDIKKISKNVRYPVVIKVSEESGYVRYANNEKELVKIYERICRLYKSQVDSGNFPQIQEYISGDGYGFFGLFNNGEPRAIFAHRRLHEYPPTGGPSSMAIYMDIPEVHGTRAPAAGATIGLKRDPNPVFRS